jgi:hypothetical protein
MWHNEKDKRGTAEQLLDARMRLNEFDLAMQRQTPNYLALKREVITNVRPKLLTLPFPKWYDYVVREWTKILKRQEKAMKPAKQPKKDYNTVGVRFLRGHNLEKVYTYRVAKKAKLRLGEEIVVPTKLEGMRANAIAVVVELHKTPQDTKPELADCYEFVFGRIQQL